MRPRYPLRVYDRAQDLLNESGDGPMPAARIAERLALEADELGDHLPDARTLINWLKNGWIVTHDLDAPWSLADSTGEDAALLLPLLIVFAERRAYMASLGWTGLPRRRLTKRQARWALKIRRAAPGLADLELILKAAAMGNHGGADLERVETFLSYAPWLDDGAALFSAVSRGLVGRDVVFEFGMDTEYGKHELTWPKEQARRAAKEAPSER